ncbi:MAG: type II toxin-antitoxin system prevent-host-death family antitoxin [Burkholderiales bacterium]
MSTATATVGLFDAKTHLSEYVSRAEAGEEVIIMRHNKPVAKLVPLSTPSATAMPAAEPPPFKQRTFDMGPLLVDPHRLGKIAADLEDERYVEIMRELQQKRDKRS